MATAAFIRRTDTMVKVCSLGMGYSMVTAGAADSSGLLASSAGAESAGTAVSGASASGAAADSAAVSGAELAGAAPEAAGEPQTHRADSMDAASSKDNGFFKEHG